MREFKSGATQDSGTHNIGWSMRTDRRTDGRTGFSQYWMAVISVILHTDIPSAMLFGEKNKLEESGGYIQDDTDVMLNRSYIHVRGAGSPLGPLDSLHSNLRSSILFLLSSVFFPSSCFIISVFQRNFIL